MMTDRKFEPKAIRDFVDNLVQVDLPEGGTPTFEEVLDDVKRLNICPGMQVMVAMPNGLPFVTIVFALLAIGAVPVLLPSSAPPSRILRMARIIGADALIASGVSSELQKDRAGQTISQIAKSAFLGNTSERRCQPGEIVLLTSGTSGIFSGCLFHTDSLFLNAARHARSIGQTSDDIVLINLPMYYSYAFVAQLLATYALGGKAIIAGPPFTPLQYKRALDDYQVTVSSLTPLMIHALLQSGSEKLSAFLRCLTIGGDSIDAASIEQVLMSNSGLKIYLTYGLTQAGPRVTTLAAHMEAPQRYASVGRPLPGIQVHLDKKNPGQKQGELIVDTDTGMLQRIDGHSTSARSAYGGRTLIKTGDIFEMDDDGYLFFRGRQPTYVVNHGVKIHLKSVCDIAETIPGIVKAETWLNGSVGDDAGFTLDIYCDDTSISERDIRRELGKVLLRAEQPAQLLIHPTSCVGWRKSAALSKACSS